jgi:hypothetical protein
MHLQLRQHAHGQALCDLGSHRLLDRFLQMTLWILLAYVARLELLGCQGRFFLYGFSVCGCEREHFLNDRSVNDRG